MRPPFAPTFGGLLFFLADPSNDRRFLVEDAASSKPKTRAKSGDFERADEKRENREIAPEVVVRSPRVGDVAKRRVKFAAPKVAGLPRFVEKPKFLVERSFKRAFFIVVRAFVSSRFHRVLFSPFR